MGFRGFILIMTCLLLGACAAPEREAAVLVLPAPQTDPSDAQMKAALQDFLAQSQAPAYSTYDYSRVDLDNDGRRDAIVLFRAPYGYWCDMHGCTMLVMKASDESFSIVSAIQPIREPLFVSNHATNGWKNLIVHVKGRSNEAKDVAMVFDGAAYPGNPESLPPYMRLAANNDLRLFYNEGT